MIKYKIEITKESRPVPIITFADKTYELAATFLLAEARSFGEEILAALDKGAAKDGAAVAFAGNVFSLEIRPDVTTICDDISGKECTIGTKELKKAAKEYVEACKKLA